MGILRIYLAISVLVAHIMHESVFGFISGKHAVELFFMVSGFYMALVMPKYLSLDHGIRTFYVARYLRLFPAYIVTFLVYVVFVRMPPDISADAPVASLYVWFVSLTMIGYESLNWVTFDSVSKALAFASSTRLVAGEPATLDMLPYMRHMWSIGIEISFYLMAPLLLRNRRTTVIFSIAALGLHWWITQNLDGYHPLRNRSVFAYLYLFALGAMACQFLMPRLLVLNTLTPKIKTTITFGLIGGFFTLFVYESSILHLLNSPETAKDSFLLVCVVLATALFVIMKTSKLDRQIGDLSYAIYIVHWPVVRTLAAKFSDLPYLVSWQIGLTLAIALMINLLIERPVDRYRSALATRDAPAA